MHKFHYCNICGPTTKMCPSMDCIRWIACLKKKRKDTPERCKHYHSNKIISQIITYYYHFYPKSYIHIRILQRGQGWCIRIPYTRLWQLLLHRTTEFLVVGQHFLIQCTGNRHFTILHQNFLFLFFTHHHPLLRYFQSFRDCLLGQLAFDGTEIRCKHVVPMSVTKRNGQIRSSQLNILINPVFKDIGIVIDF